jgi:hypothetical protein
MTDRANLLERIETNSSIFEKTSRDLRRQINQAVIDRDPPPYWAIYEHFCLYDFQISFHAFYRYARRLRFHAANLDLAELALPEGTNVADMLPELLAQRLLEVALDESASPRTIQRLADAWRITASARFTLGRHAAVPEDPKKKEVAPENNRLIDTLRRYLKASADAVRPRQDDPLDPNLARQQAPSDQSRDREGAVSTQS